MTSTTLSTAAQLRARPAGFTCRQHADAVRAAIQERVEAGQAVLYASEASGRADLLADEQRSYDGHASELRKLEAVLDGIVRSPEGRQVDYGQVLHTGLGGAAGSLSGGEYRAGEALRGDQTVAGYVRARDLTRPEEQDLSIGRYIRGMVIGDWGGADAERRAMAEGSLAGGGYAVPAPLSASIIDLARNQTRVLQAGAKLVPMENRTLDVARWEADPTAAWHSEAASIVPSDGTIGRVRLTAKTLASLTVVSRELLEDAYGIDEQLRMAMAAQFALTMDRASLYGSGTDPEPRGVKNSSGVTFQTNGANGLAPISYDFLVDAVGTLADRNETATGIIYSPRTARELGKLKDTQNRTLEAPAYIGDVPRYATNQVPNTLTQGTATTASDAFTADWSQLLIGIRTTMTIQLLTERYADTGQVGLLSWWRGDVAIARPGAFVVTTGLL